MLTQERYNYILQALEQRKAVSVAVLTKELNISESTIRRDLNALAKMGKLNKVHGGATFLEPRNKVTHEDQVEIRKEIHTIQKESIGRYAASLIEPEDFVYLDAGTTTASMLPYLEEKKAVYVTNSLEIAMNLTKRGLTTYMIAGKIRQITEAMVGCEAEKSIQNYHFTKGFFGTNGISKVHGFTTPDINEALVKKTAMNQCKRVYVLGDYTKYNVISSVTFSELKGRNILSDQIPEEFTDMPEIVLC